MSCGEVSNMKLVGIFACAVLFWAVNGDHFYFNFQEWIKPKSSEIQRIAELGMSRATSLHQALNLPPGNPALDSVEKAVRLRIAKQLQSEMDAMLGKLQQLINIVKDFSLDLADRLHEVVADISNNRAPAPETADQFLDYLIRRAKQAIDEIVKDLEYNQAGKVEDSLSSQVFQELAVRIAREVLREGEGVNMEKAVFEQLMSVVEAVFSDENGVVESGLEASIVTNLKSLVKPLEATLEGKDKEFRAWVGDQVKAATAASAPFARHIHTWARDVISSACKLCHDVSQDAYEFFTDHQGELGPVWNRIQGIVRVVLDDGRKV